MGKIKSALEIALERTESIKTDKASVGLFEARQQGKRLANDYLANPSINLGDELKKRPKDQRESLKQGIFDVLAPQITLPAAVEDLPRIEAVGKGLSLLFDERPSLEGPPSKEGGRFTGMYAELVQVLSNYLNEATQFDQAVRQQYAPKLRQKEEELSRRMGREVRIDPFQDPEFVNFYNQNFNALKANYQTAVDQVKEEAMRIWNQGDE